MATILDIGLLSLLSPIFVFLIVFVLIYGILLKTSLFPEDQKALKLIAAVSIAAVSVFAGAVTNLITVVTPWLVFLIFILVIFFLMFSFVGMKDTKEIWDTIGGPSLYFVLALIIIISGLAAVFEKDVSPFGEDQGKTVKSEVISTLTHPRMLGALFLLIVATFTIRFLTVPGRF